MAEQGGEIQGRKSKIRAWWENVVGGKQRVSINVRGSEENTGGTKQGFVDFLGGFVKKIDKSWHSYEGWHPDLSRVKPPLVPISARLLEKEGYRERNFVNLWKLEPGDIVFFVGGHHAAHYTLQKIDDKNIRLWRHTGIGAVALVGSIDKVGVYDVNSIDQSTGARNFYSGILIEDGHEGFGAGIEMPIIDYKEDGMVIKPKSAWADSVKGIWLKEYSGK